jgi:hypothetical protein
MVVNFVGGSSVEGLILAVGVLMLGFLLGFVTCGGVVLSSAMLSSKQGRRWAERGDER